MAGAFEHDIDQATALVDLAAAGVSGEALCHEFVGHKHMRLEEPQRTADHAVFLPAARGEHDLAGAVQLLWVDGDDALVQLMINDVAVDVDEQGRRLGSGGASPAGHIAQAREESAQVGPVTHA